MKIERMLRIILPLLVCLPAAVLFAGAEQNVPFETDAEWLVFFGKGLPDPASVKEKCTELKRTDGSTSAAQKLKLSGDTADLCKVFSLPIKAETEALLVNHLYALRAGKIRIGAGADWWMTCYINGRQVYTTEPDGNAAFPVSRLNHVFEADVNAGRNTIVFKLRSGAASWGFSFGPEVSFPSCYNQREVLRILFPGSESAVVGPVLLECSERSFTVAAAFGSVRACGLEWRKKGAADWTRHYPIEAGQIASSQFFRASAAGLEPDTEYEYRLLLVDTAGRKGCVPGASRFVRTEKSGQAFRSFSFLAFGDVQMPARAETMAKLLQGAGKHAMIVSLGDADNSFNDFYRSYFETFLAEIDRAEPGVLFVPVRGNHEWRGAESSFYTKTFGRAYRAFSVGNVFFIVLDTGEDKPSAAKAPYTLDDIALSAYMAEQKQWLEGVVKTPAFEQARFRVVLAHSPPSFNSFSGFMDKNIQNLCGGLFFGEKPAHKIHLWISGHYHAALRYVPVSNSVLSLDRRSAAKTKSMPCESGRFSFPVVVTGGAETITSVETTVLEHALKVRCLDLSGKAFDSFEVKE